MSRYSNAVRCSTTPMPTRFSMTFKAAVAPKAQSRRRSSVGGLEMDGLDDIAVTTGVGGKLAVFLNEKSEDSKATLNFRAPSPWIN